MAGLLASGEDWCKDVYSELHADFIGRRWIIEERSITHHRTG